MLRKLAVSGKTLAHPAIGAAQHYYSEETTHLLTEIPADWLVLLGNIDNEIYLICIFCPSSPIMFHLSG